MGTTKSTTITNLDASPSVVPNVSDSHGRVMQKCETIETAAADASGQDYRLFRINAQDRITGIQIHCDAISTGTDFDLGVYAINGGAVVDVDAFINTESLSTAIAGDGVTLDYLFYTKDVATIKQRVWEDAGVTTDPGNIQYDVALTSNTDVDGAGTISLAITYVSGS